MSIEIGSPAPDFIAPDQDGTVRTLGDFNGSWLLLYFYPEDDTPGCTKEACSFRDSFADLQKMKLSIVGVSVDSVESHRKFADKNQLPFTLLADEDKRLVITYGAWQEKTFVGKTYMGTVRSSFLIDPEGIICAIYPTVKPEEHAAEIARDLAALS